MSISSSANYSADRVFSPVLQRGTLTFVATQTCTVPCVSITSDSKVLLTIRTQTARTNPDVGLDGLFTTTITAGTGFTCVSLDVAYAGTVDYVVVDAPSPVVNVASA